MLLLRFKKMFKKKKKTFLTYFFTFFVRFINIYLIQTLLHHSLGFENWNAFVRSFSFKKEIFTCLEENVCINGGEAGYY